MNRISGNQITLDKHVIPIGKTYKQNVLKALNL
jgi:two-component system response regulator LytT